MTKPNLRGIVIVTCLSCFAGLAPHLAAQGHPDFRAVIQPRTVAISQGGISSFALTIDTPFPSKQFDLEFAGAPAGVTFAPSKALPGQTLVEIHAAPGVSAGAFPVVMTIYDHTTGSNDLYRTLQFLLRIQPVSLSAQAGTSSGPWEYTMATAASPQDLLAKANKLGSEHWEMVNTTQVLTDNRYQWVAFFKRLKQ